jgi:hypothetical protein
MFLIFLFFQSIFSKISGEKREIFILAPFETRDANGEILPFSKEKLENTANWETCLFCNFLNADFSVFKKSAKKTADYFGDEFVLNFVDFEFSCSADEFGITIVNNPKNSEWPLGSARNQERILFLNNSKCRFLSPKKLWSVRLAKAHLKKCSTTWWRRCLSTAARAFRSKISTISSNRAKGKITKNGQIKNREKMAKFKSRKKLPKLKSRK